MPKIAKKFLDGLEPRATEYFVADSALPGFGVRVSQKGRKTFGLRYRVRGRQRRYKIGVFGAMTVDQARIEAKKVLGGDRVRRRPVARAPRGAGHPDFPGLLRSLPG